MDNITTHEVPNLLPCDNCGDPEDRAPSVDVKFDDVRMQFLCTPCRWAIEVADEAYFRLRRTLLRGDA